MKIRINTGEVNFCIPVPTGLIFSKPSVWLYLKIARKYSSRAQKYIPENVEGQADKFLSNLPDEAAYALCAEIMRIKRKYGHWDLVDVESAGGERVRVSL